MQGICARLRDDRNHAAGRTACLGSIAVGLNRDLLNALNIGPHPDRTDDALVVIDAIDREIVQGVVLPIDRKASRGTPIIRARSRGQTVAGTFVCARYNLHELDEVAPVQGQILNGLCRHRRADGSIVGLQQGRGGFYIHRFRTGAGLQLHVCAGAVTSLNGQVLLRFRLEAGNLDHDGIRAHRQQREIVFATIVGVDCACLFGSVIDQRNFSVGNHSAGGVRHGTEDVCRGELGVSHAAHPEAQHHSSHSAEYARG